MLNSGERALSGNGSQSIAMGPRLLGLMLLNLTTLKSTGKGSECQIKSGAAGDGSLVLIPS